MPIFMVYGGVGGVANKAFFDIDLERLRLHEDRRVGLRAAGSGRPTR
ncbi:MAG: hypothetical protein OXL34_14555 [Gemmatimonadota bacterium]|nr:hypothetical protein [Gemmatimonadota bacterium]